MSGPLDRERFVLRGVRLIDPESGTDARRDVLIGSGVVEGVEPSLPAGVDAREYKADRWILAPGLQDMHVHLREPGGEDAETIASGALAAARGGFTRVLTMPNTTPPIDDRSAVELILRRGREACGTGVSPAGAITKGLGGKELTEMIEMREAGAIAVTDDGRPVESSDLMRMAMEYAIDAEMLVISHCEDRSLQGAGVMHEGYWSTVLGLPGIPAAAETVAIARDIALCRLTGSRLHVAHVSTAGGVDLIRRAKAEGLPVTAETAPHYLALTDEAVKSYDGCFKMNPPLRGEKDRTTLKDGLRDGTIDVIATDHAPHPAERKEVEFDRAPFGVIGLETSLQVCIAELVEPGILDWSGLVHAMSSRPASILGWGGGRLTLGRPADITLIDPSAIVTVRAEEFASLSRNCPFIGRTLRGKVLMTMAEGRMTHLEAGWLG
ncbi:MAG: dihydroorotase [Candidatus Eisenbacteria bacterium]|nr:dihydroorotase [Candidatus Eisenbacteria bacterium]